ncbi:MAG: TRAP transporter small permease [Desulfobacterota bacterium]|nr:TRAP transporter small permease [Thermodesulfobacteriota bacterium]
MERGPEKGPDHGSPVAGSAEQVGPGIPFDPSRSGERPPPIPGPSPTPGTKEGKNKLDLLLDRMNGVMAWIAALAILFMMLAISYAVLMRYVWNSPVPWIVEISSYLMLYITFLGTAWLQRKGGHVEVDLIASRLKPRVRAALKAVTSLGGAVVGFILVWKGTLVTVDYFQRDVIAIGILNTPQYLLMGIIPIGGFLLLVEFLLQAWQQGRLVLRKPDTP